MLQPVFACSQGKHCKQFEERYNTILLCNEAVVWYYLTLILNSTSIFKLYNHFLETLGI